jgi:hypothetical protein
MVAPYLWRRMLPFHSTTRNMCSASAADDYAQVAHILCTPHALVDFPSHGCFNVVRTRLTLSRHIKPKNFPVPEFESFLRSHIHQVLFILISELVPTDPTTSKEWKVNESPHLDLPFGGMCIFFRLPSLRPDHRHSTTRRKSICVPVSRSDD